MSKLEYAYYPGCAAKQIQVEADLSTRAISDKLGIVLHDMPKASCCGAGNLQEHDLAAGLAVNARIFSQAEEMGKDILTICNTCLQTFTMANKRFKEEPELLAQVNAVLEKAGVRPYEGTIEIKHLIWVLVDDLGLDKFKEQIKAPLNGLRVAPFYGCHSIRPQEIFDGKGGEHPLYLDELLKVMGADVVDYSGKDKCCGFHYMLPNESEFLSMSGGHSLAAKDKGADIMVSPCTLCDMALGAYQKKAEKKLDKLIDLPEMNIAQLIGASFGISVDDLGFYKLHQDPLPQFDKYKVEISE